MSFKQFNLKFCIVFYYILNFCELYLYPFFYLDSQLSLSFLTLILNSDLINLQRFWLNMIRFYKPHWEYIWHAILNYSYRSALAFLLSSANSLNILSLSKTVLVFNSNHESLLVLNIWEALLYFDHWKNSLKKVFLSICSWLEILSSLWSSSLLISI